MFGGIIRAFSNSGSVNSINRFANKNAQSFLNSMVNDKKFFSTNNDSKPKLRNILKRFYLMVHPDTLTSYPKEKSVNSHNMKLFMSIFDQYKKRPSPDPNTKPIVHNLSFYIPENDVETTKPIPGKFKMIDIELIQNCNNPSHIPNQIRLLFEKCSLPTDFITEIEMVDNVKLPSIDTSLRQFLLDNKLFIHQLLKNGEKQKTELDHIVKRLRKDLKVDIQLTTNPIDSGFTYHENLQALELFQEVYRNWSQQVLQKNTPGSELVRKNMLKYNLDYTETNFTSGDSIVYLDRSSTETWESYLKNLDLDRLKNEIDEERAKIMENLKKLNQDRTEFNKNIPILTKLLKVRSIQYNEHDDPTEDPKLYIEPTEQMAETLKFSNMLLKRKSEIENLMKTRFKKIRTSFNLLITPNLHRSRYLIDIDGSLKVNPNISFEEFMNLLESHSGLAIEQAKLSDRFESVRDYAQVRMGLKNLTCLSSFAYTYGPIKVFEAYQKLADSSDRLRDIGLSGFTIVIGDYYSVNRSGEIILKYDFNTEDLIKQLTAPSEEQPSEQQIDTEKKVEEITFNMDQLSNVINEYEKTNKSL
ncbi:hypothetical protein DICPUDRAFT_34848 [Dictyostelium purpureum]|uniref:DUF4460 domain-containing protein n=1 Tax=Dictyostelium purpureum TaxID=5786 RepID=F0ZNB8_DICPU|nr:uncharacterized protein DICPUDRAFT_34848 [Dictyostelium purpureum]EGC34535.1 hypothetical protein DICPUDRAFT_34848 [Dictyostelium purpureum]|eukprot:XP_003288911.1 hypothetical protein DICPUDRAFT_34848 [Dictyostelium purpureum]